MGCGTSAEVKARIETLERRNEELHQTVVKTEVEKEHVTTQKVYFV